MSKSIKCVRCGIYASVTHHSKHCYDCYRILSKHVNKILKDKDGSEAKRINEIFYKHTEKNI